MSKDNRTEKRKLGDIGENVACDFLEKRNFEIKERNYLRKWGEIDIVAKKGNIIHFVEVKSVSCTTLENVKNRAFNILDKSVTHGTSEYRPEDNMHPWKIRRLHRAIQTYLLEKKIDADWQLDLVTVKIDEKNRRARAEILENIVI